MIEEEPPIGLVLAFMAVSPILAPVWGVVCIYHRLRHR